MEFLCVLKHYLFLNKGSINIMDMYELMVDVKQPKYLLEIRRYKFKKKLYLDIRRVISI